MSSRSAEPRILERDSSESSRSLHGRRIKIALWIAVAEGVLVAILHDLSRWTIVALAAVAVALFVMVGRKLRSGLVRDALWIFAFSQLLAVVAAILALLISWLAVVLAVLFALAALAFLLFDRR